MIYRTTAKITKELELEAAIDVPACIKRELVHKLIDDLPMEKLEQIIKFECIRYDDPIYFDTPEWKRRKIMQLRESTTIEWTAKVDV